MAVKIYGAQAEINYYINNHLGTPQQMVDGAGTVVWQADYLPFGKAEVDPSSTVENNIRFPGQYYDEESGLHYNWHRYYDPSTGRYLTPDPIGLAGGMNPFLYANANPIRFIDPWGLEPWYNDPNHWTTWTFDPANPSAPPLPSFRSHPRYGNWGGAGWSGGNSGNESPVDSMDKCFQGHDLCYANSDAGGSCGEQDRNSCDQELVNCLYGLAKNPLDWPNRPKDPIYADFYRSWAIGYFQ